MTKTDAPGRIWAFQPEIFDNVSLWQDQPSPNGDTVEYVRADLAAPEWQPIETAPRDGTEILVFCPYDGVASSNFRHGCWQKLSIIMGHGSDPNEPTHWMPLPKPPAGSDQ